VKVLAMLDRDDVNALCQAAMASKQNQPAPFVQVNVQQGVAELHAMLDGRTPPDVQDAPKALEGRALRNETPSPVK
jgi:hypothetical protein